MALFWTEEQIEAIESEDDTLLVANAGTGKTTTVVGKIMWCLGLPFGVDPTTGEPPSPPENACGIHEIAAITFTDKAAYDLKRKLRTAIERSDRADELRWDIDRASISTIHTFCSGLLRENALRLGIDPTFGIIKEEEALSEQDRLIKELILERLEADDPMARLLLQRMSMTGWAKQDGVIDHIRGSIRDLRWHPELQTAQASASSADPTDKAGIEICDAILSLGQEAMSRWEAYLREANLRDFDSLILATRDLLTGEGADAVLRAIRARYRILIIDEFQDTDSAQRDIGFAIGRKVNSHGVDGAAEVDSPRPQLFLVGDPKQSIYRFRGADISVWNEVEESFREAGGRILNLSKTFRSAPPIVEFVNRAARTAIETTGEALDESGLAGRIRYAELVPGVEPFDPAGVEWLEADGTKAADRRESEAQHIAAWIQQHVGELDVRDPDTDEPRRLEYRDCAVLYPTGTDVPHYVKSLMRSGIPYFVTGAVHLNDRQEIVDVLNALRVLQAPRDDLRVFGFLRSPFVGLRDETIARIRLLSKSAPLLIQARRSLDGEWPTAPDHPELHNIERAALRRGLDLLDDLGELKARLPLDELVEELLDRSGYRLHILLMDRPDEILANLQSLVYFAETHRDLDLSAFFEVWDRYSHQKAGIKQAPLYSKSDDVVTLSTIHTAKGLEWPVVFLVGIDKSLTRPSSNNLLSDPELGPVFCLKKDDRGPLAEEIAEREQLQSSAENARLLYVATTRARDRLVIVGARGGEKGYDQWLAAGVEEEGDRELVKVRDRPAEIITPSVPSVPDLGWLDAHETTDPLPLINPIPLPPVRWIHSATELMLKAQDPEAWERQYRHGAQAPWEFAPESSNEDPSLPSTVRGDIVHGVLERLDSVDDLSTVLDETIDSLQQPELEEMLRTGSSHREELEADIRQLVESSEWIEYTEGELGRDFWKELTFTHLAGRRDWRFGAFDLFRPLGDRAGEAEGENLIVDFKTHQVTANQAARVSEDYKIQAEVYRAAAAIAGAAEVRLHFTRPNKVIEMGQSA